MRPRLKLFRKLIGFSVVTGLTGCFGASKDFAKYYAAKIHGGPYAAFAFKSSSSTASGTLTEFRRDAEVLLVQEAPASESEMSASQGFLDQKVRALFDIYSDHASPYRGLISKVVKCSPEFLPVELHAPGDKKNLRVVKLYATARRVFGACWNEDVAFKVIYAVLLCPEQKKVYELNWFGPKSSSSGVRAEDVLTDLRCDGQGS